MINIFLSIQLIYIQYYHTHLRKLSGISMIHKFEICARNVAFQDGWPLARDRNQNIYVKLKIAQWPSKRGWPLCRGYISNRGSTIYSTHLQFSRNDPVKYHQNLMEK